MTLYRLRVQTTKAQLTASVFAAMSVQWTVARAVGFGVIRDHLPFVRTSKGGLRRTTDFHAFWEAVLAGLLILGAAVLVATNYKQVREINIFAAVLVVQSLPFIAAVALAMFERSPLNEFATWRAFDARVGQFVARRLGRAPTAVPAPVPAPVSNVTELVQ